MHVLVDTYSSKIYMFEEAVNKLNLSLEKRVDFLLYSNEQGNP